MDPLELAKEKRKKRNRRKSLIPVLKLNIQDAF